MTEGSSIISTATSELIYASRPPKTTVPILAPEIYDSLPSYQGKRLVDCISPETNFFKAYTEVATQPYNTGRAIESLAEIIPFQQIPNNVTINKGRRLTVLDFFEKKGISRILRGQASDLHPFNMVYPETVLGHEISITQCLGRYLDIAPRLKPHVDMDKGPEMAWLHDLAEIVVNAGQSPIPDYLMDIPMYGPEREHPVNAELKRNEQCIGLALLEGIEDNVIRETFKKSYSRYMEQNPEDITALFVNYADKSDGTCFVGMRYIFSQFRKHGFSRPTRNLKTHIEATLPKVTRAAERLCAALPDEDQIAVDLLFAIGLENMAQGGYTEAVSTTVLTYRGGINNLDFLTSGSSKP